METYKKYKAITVKNLLTYFPPDTEIEVTLMNPRHDFKVEGTVDGKEVKQYFGHQFIDNVKIIKEEELCG